MFSILLVLTFAYLNSAQQNLSVVFSFASGDTTCSGGYVGFVARAVSSCSFAANYTCTCVGSICSSANCQQTIPSDPPGAIVLATYNSSSSDCTGNIQEYIALSSGECQRDQVNGGSQKITCAGSYEQVSYTTDDCSGDGQVVASGPNPGTRCEGGFYLSCALKCFHKESSITIGEKQYTLEDLKKEDSPCAIPHEFKANGLKVFTTCPGVLRVTSEHLVMTQSGWKMAGLLKTGDKLFSKVHAENPDCTITDIQTDIDGHYFGLNCETAHVESDGYWVSTFGLSHNIPAAWMRWGSKIFGVKTASKIGDSVANLLQRLGLI